MESKLVKEKILKTETKTLGLLYKFFTVYLDLTRATSYN